MTWHLFCVGQLFWDVGDGPGITPLNKMDFFPLSTTAGYEKLLGEK